MVTPSLLYRGFSFSTPFAPITLKPPSLLSKLNPSYALRARYTRRTRRCSASPDALLWTEALDPSQSKRAASIGHTPNRPPAPVPFLAFLDADLGHVLGVLPVTGCLDSLIDGSYLARDDMDCCFAEFFRGHAHFLGSERAHQGG